MKEARESVEEPSWGRTNLFLAGFEKRTGDNEGEK